MEKKIAFNSAMLLVTVLVVAYLAFTMRGEAELTHERLAALEKAEDARRKRRKPATTNGAS